MSITIREYVAADYEALLEMEIELVDTMSKIDPHKRFRSREDLNAKKYFDVQLKDITEHNGKTFIAEIDGVIVGYLMGKIETRDDVDAEAKYPGIQGYIEALFVDEKYRSQGVSSRLIEEIEKHFKGQNCNFSTVACVAVNEAARNLYAKAGYGEQYVLYIKKL
jgi:GNAT superfamily N-acetyltransferase